MIEVSSERIMQNDARVVPSSGIPLRLIKEQTLSSLNDPHKTYTGPLLLHVMPSKLDLTASFNLIRFISAFSNLH